ncbi:hypothetical protein BGY98DRAFT_952380 [Russula aff. rugulosa BPL654]|nr:hypothetical protein BGY98DRAFT_952380 [Russula aff. rugulosa BPL654]
MELRWARSSVRVLRTAEWSLGFYPLCIIIGAEHESSVVSKLPFVTFRHATSVRIVVESEAIRGGFNDEYGGQSPSVRHRVLDHFNVAPLDVVIGCARKTEMAH